MNIEQRIDNVMKKIDKLSDKKLRFSGGKFPPVWEKPFTEKQVSAFEKIHHITLPQDYKTFITTTASSGTQPFYGLYSIVSEIQQEVAINKKFQYTVRKPLNIAELSDEEYDKLFEEDDEEQVTFDAGYIYLCHEGCGMYSILIVNTDDKNTYGTVWYCDIANDAGMFPLIDTVSKTTMNFLDWLEYYADKILKSEYSEYFSYGQLAGKIE
ncbi:MAG: SMI1/KNR4 family protein [Firmicutes bacterium]|nr:SMI1/KNR4 family protein [Bacillota bacterium]